MLCFENSGNMDRKIYELCCCGGGCGFIFHKYKYIRTHRHTLTDPAAAAHEAADAAAAYVNVNAVIFC